MISKTKIFENYYRIELKKLIFKILVKWQRKVGVKVNELKITNINRRENTLVKIDFSQTSLPCHTIKALHFLVNIT